MALHLSPLDRRTLFTASALAPCGGAAASGKARLKPAFPPYAQTLLTMTGTARKMPVHHVYCNGTESYPGYFNRTSPVSDDSTGRPIAYFYHKGDDAVVAAGQDVPYPIATNDLQGSVQLVLAIGKAGYKISVDQAVSCIFGVAAGVSLVRADQIGHPETSIALTPDRSALCSDILPLTPGMRLDDQVATLKVHGVVKQKALLSRLPWRPEELISRLSMMFPLAPGDLIYCGPVMAFAKVPKGGTLQYGISGVADAHNTIV